MNNMLQQFRTYPLFFLFLMSYATVHLHFEYNFWSASGMTIFDKYALAADWPVRLAIAEQVYYAKAGWCFALIMLQALGLRFYTALSISFLLYGFTLLLFFPPRIYVCLNLLLALGMLIEVVVRRREPAPCVSVVRKEA